MDMKKIMLVFVAVFAVFATMGVAFAQDACTDNCFGDSANTPKLDVQDCLVRINDRTVQNDVVVLKAFDRGQDLEIRAEFVSLQDAQDVQVAAFLTGYHRSNDNIFDITPSFDVDANVSYEKTLNLVLPDDFQISNGDELKVRLVISDKFSSTYVREYNLKVDAARNSVVIKDVILDPSNEVEAGRGLFANVRVKNMGEGTEDSIKITTAIPALNLKATEYIDSLDSDEATTSEDMFLRIPVCAEEGDYTVKTTVEYADGDESTTDSTTISVLANPDCESSTSGTTTQEDKTVVTVPGRQDVKKGTQGTVYPIILENKGSTDRAYQLQVNGLDVWADYRFEPGTYVVVKAGQIETAYLYVTPKADAAEGEKVFMVEVDTAGDKKQIALTANVVAGDNTQNPSTVGNLDMKQVLEYGFIAVVVLIIVLLLVIGFNKLKGAEDEPEDVSGQTYY